jgi:hypothetical protein
MNTQLTLADELRRPPEHACDCPRRSTCPRCDPDYVEQDGDRAAGIVSAGPVPYGVIPY